MTDNEIRTLIKEQVAIAVAEAMKRAGYVQNVDVENMSPVTLVLGNLRFDVGIEDPRKRKHVHVISPDGKIKFWLEPVEYDRRGDEGKFNKKRDFKVAEKQVKANHNKFVKDINDYFAGRGNEVQISEGKKIKGKNRP